MKSMPLENLLTTHSATSSLLHCHMMTTQILETEEAALPLSLNLKFRNAAQKKEMRKRKCICFILNERY
jgi:hypothetical protein